MERTSNLALIGGGCCGGTFLPLEQVSGYEWSVGLAFNWMIFDAGGTSNRVKALQLQDQATAEQYANTRNAIRLRLERAFLNHEASLAKLVSARRAVGASKEAFEVIEPLKDRLMPKTFKYCYGCESGDGEDCGEHALGRV